MLTVFYWKNDALEASVITAAEKIPERCVWVDASSPTPEEENSLKAQLGMVIPTHEEVWKNHTLNRMYVENGISYMNAVIISKMDSPHPVTSAVTFVLFPGCLVTIRSIAPTSFKNFAARLQKTPKSFTGGPEVLEGLLEEMITRVAHNSEVVVEELDALSHQIFGTGARVLDSDETPSPQMMKDSLCRLGSCADLNSKINESLHSIHRLLQFFRERAECSHEVKSDINVLVSDALELIQQNAFLSDKITFQLDAALGMINVEQNSIIKVFSVVTLFFLPPTLVSSIYGMNFEHMPELHSAIGYPLALALMAICAGIPYLYFHRKGWL